MPWWAYLLIAVGVILIAAVVFIVIFGRKMQRKQAETEKQMAEVKQTATILVIDKQKKKMKNFSIQ